MRRGGTTIVVSALVFAVALVGCDSGTTDDAAPAAREAVTVVSQNLLHGISCPADSDRCRLSDRVELFTRQLTEAGCPEVAAVQEVDPVMSGMLGDRAGEICDGRYELVGGDDPSIDREVVLTTLPVLGEERVRLAGPLRTALWVRVRAAVGPLDVVATHLASGSDDRPCDRTTCPPPCEPEDSLRTCQARQVADLLDDRSVPESVGVLIGDLNARPGEPTIEVLTSRGHVDTFLAAGNAECDAAGGVGCTGGREDADLSDLTDPDSRQSARIDYIFLATERECRVADSSGLFAAEPASSPVEGLVYASDHTGVQARISCATSDADRAAARRVPTRSTSTTTPASELDAATAAAITDTFETVFNGGGDVETRLESLEDADELRESLIARFEDPETKAVLDQVQVRIDGMQPVDADHVGVTYSILLGEAEVLGQLPGAAVREDGRWLVSRASYCQVATLGLDTVPEACR